MREELIISLLREILDRQRDQGETIKDIEQNILVGDQEEYNNALYLQKILSILQSEEVQITDFKLSQLQGASFMAILGTQVGATSTFQIGFVPPGGVPLPTPPTVMVDDPLVTLGPVSTDGQFTFTAAVAATDTGASYNLTVAGTNAAGTALSHVFNVPILSAPPVQITDFTLNQLS
jgi:hypothetical protein